MITYLMELTLVWAALFIFYVLLLRRQTYFQLNRFYLLAGILAGVLLPLLALPLPENAAVPAAGVWLPRIAVGEELDALNGGTAGARVAWPWWMVVWMAGAFVALIRLLYGCWQINRLLQNSRKERRAHYILVTTERLHTPFSFGPFLFWSRHFEPEAYEAWQIQRHEEAHIRQGHTWDVLLLEVAGVLLWWHPLVYAFRYSLREVHEYLADAAVLEHTTRRQYGALLLLRLQPGLQPALGNHFQRSQLKRRLLMMARRPSGRQAAWRYLAILPLLATLIWACSLEQPEETIALSPVTATESANASADTVEVIGFEAGKNPSEVVERDVFKIVEEMPRFPGCEEADLPPAEREQCAKREMLASIYSNIRYPQAARRGKIEGVVVARFIVNKDGQISDAEILRGLGGGCDEEVLRVIKEMPRWIPGRQRGQAVAVQFNLPVKFKLEE